MPSGVPWSERAAARVLRASRGRPLGLVLLGALVLLAALPEAPVRRWMRHAAVDGYHALRPREPLSAPAVVVDVDEASLRRHGQWPWPRTRLAELLLRIGEGGPAAIGVDILMPEPDRLSPPRLPALLPDLPASLVATLSALPDSDLVLAATLRRLPVALGVAGLERAADGPPAPPGPRTPVRLVGGDPRPFLRRYAGVTRSRELLDGAAPGHGLLNELAEGGVVRRVPLVAAIDGEPVPALGLEMVRLAAGAPAVTLRVGPGGVTAVGVGDLLVPTEPDGSVWLRFAPHDPGRFVSAADVLAGAVPADRFARRLVLVGVTALGLVDAAVTPVEPRMPGVEVHAQLLESLFDGSLLVRPRWAAGVEGLALASAGLLLVWAVPVLGARRATAFAAALLAVLLGGGFVLYDRAGLLLDVLFPAAGAGLCFAGMLGAALAEADSQRRALARALADAREAAARLAGELEAARRIQMGLLPRAATALAGDRRVELHARLEPARVVGGDLYDFCRLAGDRLFVLVGDVSGKGLPAALFMALARSVLRNQALRGAGDVAAVIRGAAAELGPDNPEALFVTVLAAVLDLETGTLELCNAGHETPYVLGPDAAPRPLTGDGGPPLGVLDEFPYQTTTHRLRPGETLCVVTDGVTEAASAGGALYGRGRLEALLGTLAGGAVPEVVGEAIRADIGRFTAGVEPADDLAILVLRWLGPAPGARAVSER